MIPPTTVALPSAPLPQSLKGYELTSFIWQDDWYFVFDVGLNSVRVPEDSQHEIGLRHTVRGIEALKATVAQLAWGEHVTWCALELSGTSIVEELVTFGRERGVIIVVISS